MTKPFLGGHTCSLLGLSTAILTLASSLSAHAEMRDFKSAQGSIIHAELKKVKGTMIILRKEDGKEIQTALTNFAPEDQNFILKWMAEDPLALDYNFMVKAEENQLADTKKTSNKEYERVSTIEKNYTVTVQNSSHNKVDDMTLDWCVFMLNKVQPSRYSSGFSSSDTTTGDLFVKHGTEVLPDMTPSRNFTFNTKAFNIDSIIDKYYTGAKVKDKLQGVWLRFYRKDVLVFEWKSPIVPKTDWGGGPHVAAAAKKDLMAKNDPPSKTNKSSGTVKPATTADGKPMEKDDDSGDIVKIFQLEDGEMKK